MHVLRALMAEILLSFWSGMSQLGFIALGIGGFVALLFLGGYQIIPKNAVTPSIMDSFAVFAFVLSGSSGPVRLLEEHRIAGTLEQLFLSVTPVWVLGFMRSITNLITYVPALVVAFVIFRVGGVPPLEVTVSRVVMWLCVFTGSLGLGYAVGSLSLLGPHGGRALGFVLFAMMALSLFESSQQGISAVLFSGLLPTAATRLISYLDGPQFWQWGRIGIFAVLNIVYLIAGFVIFTTAEKRALRRGTLLRYYNI